MKINMTLTNRHVKRLREQKSELNKAQSFIQTYQRNLNMYLKGVEMLPTNEAIDSITLKLTEIETALEFICNDIVKAADDINNEEGDL